MRFLTAIVVLAMAGSGGAEEKDPHADCPMRAQHTAQVNARHDAATHVSHEASTHHFLLSPDGGVIRLEANDAADTVARDGIRTHLRHVARAFAAGEFDLPMLIHDRTPPGVEVMRRKKDEIRYTFAETPRGGEVQIATKDAEAKDAVRAFLRFQIEDHATGDPVE